MKQQRQTHTVGSFGRTMCLILIFSIVCLTGAVAPETGTETSLPLANLPPNLNATASTQDKNIIWYVKIGEQDAKQLVTFTVSYNQAFLRVCDGVRTSDVLATNGTMYTSTGMNPNNSILQNIYYTYLGKSVGVSTSIGGVTIDSPYYKVRKEDCC